jgi:hypothetical protein
VTSHADAENGIPFAPLAGDRIVSRKGPTKMKATGYAVINRKNIYIAIFACSLFFARAAQACTGIRLIAEDGSVVCARTLEFGIDLDST